MPNLQIVKLPLSRVRKCLARLGVVLLALSMLGQPMQIREPARTLFVPTESSEEETAKSQCEEDLIHRLRSVGQFRVHLSQNDRNRKTVAAVANSDSKRFSMDRNQQPSIQAILLGSAARLRC